MDTYKSRQIPVKYIFLDIVGFSHNRSVQAQASIIANLNGIVRDAAQPFLATNSPTLVEAFTRPALTLAIGTAAEVLYFPTGDGICIAMVNPL